MCQLNNLYALRKIWYNAEIFNVQNMLVPLTTPKSGDALLVRFLELIMQYIQRYSVQLDAPLFHPQTEDAPYLRRQ